MAERRMFAKTIIDSDTFIDMPVTARLLYYDLAMRADDDGFVNSPKKIMRMIGASQDDMSVLIMKKFIIPFESGVVVIKHWRIHNYIRKDMYHSTKYKDEMSSLSLDENNAYTLENSIALQPCNDLVTNSVQPCNENGTTLYTQDRLGKDRLGKVSIEKEGKAKRFSPPSLEDVKAYCLERKNGIDAETFISFYESNGWKVGKNPMKDWRAAVRTWEKRQKQDKPDEKPKEEPKVYAHPFDDGSDPEYTRRCLEAQKRRGW